MNFKISEQTTAVDEIYFSGRVFEYLKVKIKEQF